MSPYVQVPVPEEHVPAVYAFLAELSAPQAKPPSPEPEAPPELDEELVRQMYQDSWETHEQLLVYLAGRAGEWVPSEEIIDELSLNGRKGLAGMFGAFGRRANHRYGGAKPWAFQWDDSKGEGNYRMSEQVAAWILDVAGVSK